MKILLISDLHGQDAALKYLDKFLTHQQVDLVIAAGDITDRNDKAVRYLHSLLDIVLGEHGTEFYGLHGNNDHPDILELLQAMGRSIHMRTVTVRGLSISGIGGSADLSEQVIDDPNFHIEGTLLVTHVPPKYDKKADYFNVPIAHVSGHIHVDQPFTRKNGKVTRIQLGALKDGWIGIMEYPSLTVRFHNMKKKFIKKR